MLLDFFLPACFRVGYLVRCCTWEGRSLKSGEQAKQVLEEIFVLLVHLFEVKSCKNEYVRTLAVALATWQPVMSKFPGVCFAEESCEALLSRMSHRCEVYRHLHGFDATFNLFLTLPQPSKAPKGTRGTLKRGLVSLFAARIRKIVFSDGDLPFAPTVAARQMHSEFVSMFPDDISFPGPLKKDGGADHHQRAVHHAVRTLMGKVAISDDLLNILTEKVPRRADHDLVDYNRAQQLVDAWSGRTRRPNPKPAAKKQLMPKPKAQRLTSNL